MEDERLFEELPPLPEETSFPEQAMLPEYTPVYPDASFFQESAVTAREENIFHGQTPEGEEALIRSEEKKRQRRSRFSALRQLLGSAARAGAAVLAAAAVVSALALGTDPPVSESHVRFTELLQTAKRPPFKEVLGYGAGEFAGLWAGDPDAPHRYDEEHPVVIRSADCLHTGEAAVVCTECGVRKTVTTPAGGHINASPVEENRKEPSCTEEGSYDAVVYCQVCRAELSRTKNVISAAGHTADAAVAENAAPSVCTAGGSYEEVVYCAVCRAELSRRKVELTAPGHTPAASVKENRVEASCTSEGSFDRVVYCLVCHEELSRQAEVIPALGHVAGSSVREKEIPASCTAEGSYDSVVYCLRCGEELSRETVTLPLTDHIEAQETEENRLDPGCTEEGFAELVVYCDICGLELSRRTVILEAAGHEEGEPVIEDEEEAGCTEEGSYDTVVYCLVCGEELSREHTVIPAAGHTPGRETTEHREEATCTAAGGYDQVTRCTDCGEVVTSRHVTIAALGHNYSSEIHDPTCTAQGYTTHTCSRCRNTYRDSYVAALGHDFDLWEYLSDNIRRCSRCNTPAVTLRQTGKQREPADGSYTYTFTYTVEQDFLTLLRNSGGSGRVIYLELAGGSIIRSPDWNGSATGTFEVSSSELPSLDVSLHATIMYIIGDSSLMAASPDIPLN